MGYEMPVFITSEEFGDSLDVFPIEFRLMKRAYRMLYGQDLLAGREASKEHLRWQTEHELRGKLLRLRSLALPASESSRSIGEPDDRKRRKFRAIDASDPGDSGRRAAARKIGHGAAGRRAFERGHLADHPRSAIAR